MHIETLIFIFKIIVILFYVIGGVIFFNPLINVFDLGKATQLRFHIEQFFYKFGVFGYWGVFTSMTENCKDIKLSIKTSRGDYVWYFMKDHRIPFLEAKSDNCWVLLVHTLNSWGPCDYDMLFYKNLFKRARNFYEKQNIEILEFKLELVGLRYGCDKDYMHELSLEPHRRTGLMFSWHKDQLKEGEPALSKGNDDNVI